ncbi:MAG TPA: NAD(P)/FAD-dependent oxidoreductase [Myxococcales bacterium]|nr:NAD(P)/FAD-dependent oxidoreductase [Myxococcales bacterium]
MADAAVVGSGPNGLAAAIALARAGVRVRVHEAQPTLGGGTRSAALTLPGFLHDVCSAIHPLAVASPFFARLPLAEHGLEWIHPGIAVAHPLPDGTAVALHRSLEETAENLGSDARAYRRIVAPLAARFPDLLGDVLRPIARVPRHPLLTARFGARALLSASALPFRGERARALVAGLAAHSFLPLEAPFTASFALIFAAAAHASGWPMARGGSQRIADALAASLRALGGEICTGDPIDSLDGFGPDSAVLFDTSPATLERIAGDRLPARYRRALRAYRRGPGVFKLDYALSAPVPWRAPECRRAGTVHVGGTFAEIAASEDEVVRGGHPGRPFVLVAQQSLFDPTRAPAGKHTLWAYCHVPNGSDVDMTSRIEAQLERFAPGFAGVVLARAVTRPADIEAANANCAGGDISGGAHDGLQFLARPVLAFDPYATPAPNLYLCSSSTPPGAGVHGMCGLHAAESALRRSFGIRRARHFRVGSRY